MFIVLVFFCIAADTGHLLAATVGIHCFTYRSDCSQH